MFSNITSCRKGRGGFTKYGLSIISYYNCVIIFFCTDCLLDACREFIEFIYFFRRFREIRCVIFSQMQ